MMSIFLKDVKPRCGSLVFSYKDDVLNATSSLEDYLCLLREICAAIQNAGLKLNPKKSDVLKESMKYFRRIVDRHGVRPDSEQAATIRAWITPGNRKEMQSLLGLAN